MRPASPVAAPDASAIEQIVRRVRERSHAEPIVLFGSRATLSARTDSDYDLLIVVPDEEIGAALMQDLTRTLRDDGIEADIHLRTAAQYQEWRNDPGLIDFLVAREGVLLYAAPGASATSDSSRALETPPTAGLRKWIERAESDLLIAEQSLDTAAPVLDGICFHAHACAEKMLKALIVRSGVFPPRTHDLGKLLAMQAPAVAQDRRLVEACAALTSVYPKSRYPELEQPTLAEARVAEASARAVHRTVRPLLP